MNFTIIIWEDILVIKVTDYRLYGVGLITGLGREQSVHQFVLVSGSPLGPMTRLHPYPFFNDSCFVLPVGRPLWREDGSVTYSAIADWSGYWGPITIHYRLVWDCVPSSSPLTTRRDYGGVILTRLHTGCLGRSRSHISTDCQAPIWDPRPILLSPWNFLQTVAGL
jgi:hypothetical protein